MSKQFARYDELVQHVLWAIRQQITGSPDTGREFHDWAAGDPNTLEHAVLFLVTVAADAFTGWCGSEDLAIQYLRTIAHTSSTASLTEADDD